MFKNSYSVHFTRQGRCALATGLLLSFSLAWANNEPSLQEARSQVNVWQGELAKARRSGDTAAIAAAEAQIRDWESIVKQRVAEEKRQQLLKKAKENAAKAEEIARRRNMQVPAHLKGDQRVMYIIRQDMRMEEQEKTAREKALQEQLRNQLAQAITGRDYNRAKQLVVNQGVKADIELVQMAVNAGVTGIAYLLVRDNDKLLSTDVDRVLGKALISAAQAGDQDRVQGLLKLGADVNYTEGDMTPMKAATRSGRMQIISLLLSQGARRDPQALGRLLFDAVQRGDQNRAAALLKMGASADYAADGATTLSTALDKGNLGLATLLINGGATADPRILGRTLFRLVEQGDGDKVTQLLKMGADVNYVVNGKTPLTAALSQQNMGMASLLINAGGQDPSGQFGRKLFDAALEGDMRWVNVLAKIEKYRDYRNGQGETPLHAAASKGHADAVSTLLNAGANPNALTVKNWSPLHHAARFGHKIALMQLLKGGADAYLQNSDGYDAYQLASVAMRNSKNEIDNRGVLEYIRLWQQYHPRPQQAAVN